VLRETFKEKIEQYNKAERVVVYIDESGFSHDMPRTHGYSTIGKRCYAEKDWHSKGRVNAIGAIINNQLLTVSLFDSNINSDIFYAWLTQDLIPKLPEQSVLVMDNATFHKRLDMKQAIKRKSHTLLYLPSYSPDLNPIEHKWAQIKAIRRQKRCSAYEVFSFCNFLC